MTKCSKCGDCCRVVIFKIGNSNQISKEYFKARGIKQDSKKLIIPHKCVQLNSKGECMIHEQKPFACRKFPFDLFRKINKELLPSKCVFNKE